MRNRPQMGNRAKTTSSLSVIFLLLCFLLSLEPTDGGLVGRAETRGRQRTGTKKKVMFVFGDSYADTGNWERSSWKLPYGVTFPGKPTGRFSDGRILTDFIAAYLGISSPVPYEQRRSRGAAKKLRFGMNFAFGGTGVFDTADPKPNMTSQIHLFKRVLHWDKLYTKSDLKHSVALVSLAGNDYANYLRGGGVSANQSLQEFARSVVAHLGADLNRIHRLGVPRIMVTGLEPVGCLPTLTMFTAYQNCSEAINRVASYHNRLLARRVKGLNRRRCQQPAVFFILDLYRAFISALKMHNTGENPLRPCCLGTSGEYGCGSSEGKKTEYTVCRHRDRAFFWDSVHPAQAGWFRVFLALRRTLKLLS